MLEEHKIIIIMVNDVIFRLFVYCFNDSCGLYDVRRQVE